MAAISPAVTSVYSIPAFGFQFSHDGKAAAWVDWRGRPVSRALATERVPEGERLRLRALVGAGDRIAGLTLPFAVVGIAANVIWPSAFHMGLGRLGLSAGIVLLAVGVPLWLTSAALILVEVPKGRLITRGPFALMLHPLYTSVALLVIPGCGFVLDTWVGPAIGAVLYVASRIFSPREERTLESSFPSEYRSYRARVILPWL